MMLESHMQGCVKDAIQSDKSEKIINELAEVIKIYEMAAPTGTAYSLSFPRPLQLKRHLTDFAESATCSQAGVLT